MSPAKIPRLFPTKSGERSAINKAGMRIDRRADSSPRSERIPMVAGAFGFAFIRFSSRPALGCGVGGLGSEIISQKTECQDGSGDDSITSVTNLVSYHLDHHE